MPNAEESFEKGCNEGWYCFVEGYDFPDYDMIDAAYNAGLEFGWEKAEATKPPTPEFVKNETSKYFDKEAKD